MSQSKSSHVSDRKPLINISGSEFKSLDEKHMKRLRENLITILADEKTHKYVHNIVFIHEHTEPTDIQSYVLENLENFQPITQHKIRTYVNRKLRESFKTTGGVSSVKDSTISVSPPTSVNNDEVDMVKLNVDFCKLWKIPSFQKAVVNILFNNKELNLESMKMINVSLMGLQKQSVKAIDLLIKKTYSLMPLNVLPLEDLIDIHLKLYDISEYDVYSDSIFPLIEPAHPEIDEVGIVSLNLTKLDHQSLIQLREMLSCYSTLAMTNFKDPVTNKVQSAPVGEQPISGQQPSESTTAVTATVKYDNNILRILSTKVNEYFKTNRENDQLSSAIVEIEGCKQCNFNLKKMKPQSIQYLLNFFDIS